MTNISATRGNSVSVSNSPGAVVAGGDIELGDGSGKKQARSLTVFLSYRRNDTNDASGRIFDHLVATLGQESVFKDVYSIEPGADFSTVIRKSVSMANVFLAIIGRDWNPLVDGRRRMDDPTDWVRLEIEAAIAFQVLLIPVLANNAQLPRSAEVPPSVQGLLTRHTLAVRPDPDFRTDIAKLFKAIGV